ncbi:ATP-dependent nuclease [Coprococcus comes]|uniref:ATP-dependent nuclease n=1 Tax=Coprococcus comes TaxID=410072 RepID=UPI00200394C5|nr:AAA family ATPase [Coprococcus comes]
MFIRKVKIHNFKCYRDFEITLEEGLNIVVGDNEAGKSTILEAINLALTGIISGKSIWNEISQYIFNKEAVDEYIVSLGTTPIALPYITIEIFFGGDENPLMNGDANSDRDNSAEGFCFKIAFNDKYADEYEALVQQGDVKSLPIEYYDITWTTFARDVITTRSIPYKSSLIDSSEYRYQSGNDLYLSRIIKGSLEPEDITSIAQAHRKMRDTFINDPSIEAINNKINQDASLTDKKIALSVELVTKNAWENSLVTQLDEIPFHYMGKGEQCVVKTELALAKRTSQNASIILLEEPENHLSHTRLNQLIKCISEQYAEKQILISTHSSFVANKLGLGKVMLLDNLRITKFSELSEDTYNFFKKVAGYDTLRMILCKKAILCEGDSDELVIQKAYMQLNDGRLPIEDGIEVISVGVSFLRFLEIADCIQTKSRLLQITMGIWQLSTKSMKII